MFDDPIVAEVRQARREILDSFGGDYKAMLRAIRLRQEERKKKHANAFVATANLDIAPVESKDTPPFVSKDRTP